MNHNAASRRRRRPPRNQNRVPKEQKFDSNEITLEIEQPAHGGTCVAHANDKVYFVRHTIPGETVLAKPYAAKGKVVFCDAIKILVPSPERIPTLWKDAGPAGVGGGELCHVSAKAQASWKAAVIKDVIRRIGGRELATVFAPYLDVPDDILVWQASPLVGGRTRVEFVIDRDQHPAMYVTASQETLPLTSLPLMSEAINRLNLWAEDSVWRELWKPGDRVRIIDTADGLFIRIGTNWFDETGHQMPLEEVHYEVNGKLFAADPNGFWQAHKAAPRMLQDIMADMLQGIENDCVLELYSGSGLLTQAILNTSSPKTLLSIEGDCSAVEFARRNICHRGVVHECAPINADLVSQRIKELARTGQITVVADPPRTGLSRGLISSLSSAEVTEVILISCDPAAFARDAAKLQESGFEPVSLKVLDIFPGTYHFETVSRFSKLVKA